MSLVILEGIFTYYDLAKGTLFKRRLWPLSHILPQRTRAQPERLVECLRAVQPLDEVCNTPNYR
jgi:hypothetical protein